MSLQVWLPLTKDLRQQGLSNATVTNNGATFDSMGKLGGCYTFGSGKYMRATPTSSLMQAKAVSVACWVKITSWNSSYDCLMSWADGTGWTNSRVTLARNNTSSNLRFTIADGTNYAGVNCTTTLALNTWYHVVGTYDGSNIKIYINGNLEGTAASTLSIIYAGTFNIGGWSGNNYPINGSLNDIRLYNHCLSQMEVKELAKGLILHYPLNDASLDSKPNLVPPNYWTGSKSLSLSANTTSYSFMNYPTMNVQPNKTYYWTIDVRITSGAANLTNLGIDTNCIAGGYSGNDSAHTVITVVNPNLTKIKAGEWQTAYCITTVKSDATNPQILHCLYGASSTATTVQVEYRNLMLVEASSVVPLRFWQSNITYDCSGLCNNGTCTGTFTITNDTARYNASTIFTESPNAISFASNFSHLTTFTYNCWIKTNTAHNAFVLMGYQYGNNTSGSLALDSGTSKAGFHYYAHAGGQGDVTIGSNVNYYDNQWHMLTATYDGSKIITYFDGVKTAEGSVSLLTSSRTFSLNQPSGASGRYFKGQMSDARVYATALSAEDVLELYHTAARIDNVGNTYVYQYIET